MPKSIHDKLAKTAKKIFGTSKSNKANAYIYGTLAKIKAKGKL